MRYVLCLAVAAAHVVSAQELRWALPEKTRLLVNQRFDLVLEARGIPPDTPLSITINGAEIRPRFSKPREVDLDCDSSNDWTVRLDLYSFAAAGIATVRAA